ncbi:MAG: ribosome biogenesis GTP-binding protein YihA/YsxC [Saprospiraceae bacterium]
MLIREANYEGSFPKFSTLPSPRMPEYCFWGRSNVGKSSIINYICNRKDLALISGNPGKTINFNFFNIDNTFHIVDLPGFGYARVSKKMRNLWSVEIDKYLIGRVNLVTVFLLIDCSIPIQEIDLEKISMLGEHHIPFVILFTKSDRCKKIELKHNIQKFKDKLSEQWDELPPLILTSAEKRIGKEEILEYIFLHLNSVEINANN